MSNQTNDLYQYSETEKQRIYQAIAKVTAQTTGEEPTAIGNWVPFYQELSLIMAEHINNPVGISSDNLTDMKNFKLWLDVAIGANGGTGMHSAFIRTFTDVQGELRIGRKFTDAEMQLASNGVAFNLWKDIKGENRDKPEIAWKVGKIGAVADSDASSIGKNLYDKIANLPDKDDTAITTNAGWSGTIGFNLLGGVPPFESDRLYNGNNEDGKFDKLDDLKNILFAVYSYEQAFKAGAIAGAKNLSELLLLKVPDDLEAQWNIARSSGNYIGLILGVLERTPIVYDVAQVILGFGYENFLDIMIGTITGEVPKQKTTTENFVNNAQEFFNKFSGMELREKISVIALPEKIEDIMSLAKNDIGVRVALKNLSPFSFSGIDYAQHNSNGELSLYSKDNPNGLTEIYLTKRAEMLSAWLQDKIDPYYTPNNAFIDIDLDIRLDEPKIDYGHGNNGIRQHQSEIIFGGTGNDTIKAKDVGDNNNFLFGGTGNDTLIGNSGNDYLEGGQGFDTYHITDHDTIFDSDGKGEIVFDGKALPTDFIKRDGSSNIWEAKDSSGNVLYTAIKGANDLLITSKDSPADSVSIKDFFGIATQRDTMYSALSIILGDSQEDIDKNRTYTIKADDRYLSNIYTGGFPADYLDVYGSQKVDNIFGTGTKYLNIDAGDGNDMIFGGDKGDIIVGGAGHDIIYGSAGFYDFEPTDSARLPKPSKADEGVDKDLIIGGTGNDLIAGGIGDDVIWVDDDYTINTNISADEDKNNPNNTHKNDKGDWLVGGSGHDVLFGSQRQDFLQGGIGSDTLFGGSGHDVLLGDGNIRFAQKSNSIYDLSYFCRTI